MHEDIITSRFPPISNIKRYIRFARRFNSANAEELHWAEPAAAHLVDGARRPRRLQNGARGGRSRDQAASWLRKASCESGREGEVLPPPPPVPVSQVRPFPIPLSFTPLLLTPVIHHLTRLDDSLVIHTTHIFHCPCFPDLSLSTTPAETFARRRGQVIVTGSHASSWTSTTTIYLAHKSNLKVIIIASHTLKLSLVSECKAPRSISFSALNCSSFVMMPVHLLIGLLNLAQQPEQDPTSVKLQHTRSSNKYTDCATRWIFFLDCGGLGKQVWPLPKDAIGKFQSLWYYDHWLET
ncbi:hypothetical protein K438DRAFT_1787075 [Mycena galopus ATCC 62051]|nr:hypothetical protein K438DRAFT_1787075 [Mycena galopus ATCC 62051]